MTRLEDPTSPSSPTPPPAAPGGTRTARDPGPLRRAAVAAAVLVAASGLALVLAEAILRIAAPATPGGGLYVWTPGIERSFHPVPGRMQGVAGTSTFRTSSLGLRADELAPDATPKVLAVGGSTTECLYLDQDEAWPALMQERLGPDAWVGNAGVSGRLTRDHVVQLEHLLPALPRLDRVVLLIGVNDLMLVLGQGESYDPRGLDAPGERERAFLRAFDVVPRAQDPAGFPRSTALWRRVLVPWKRRLSPPQVQDDAGAIYATWRAHRADASSWIDALPDLGPALAEYDRNVRALARVCSDAGARPLFLTQPCLWTADAPPEIAARFWMGGVGAYQKEPGAAYYTAGALADGMARFNAALVETCAAVGADCLDLAAVVPPDPAAFYDDVHFSEEGARRVAEAVAAALR